MNYKLNFELSAELEVYRDRIEASIQPYLELKITDNGNPSLWQTKFGGLPYLPKNFEYPQSWDGKYLYLLAQINFSELPHLDDFPERGILQFYIIDDGEFFGLDYQNPTRQNNFRILYFPDPDLEEDRLITDFSFLPEHSPYFPLKGCCAVEAIEHYAPVSIVFYLCYYLCLYFSIDEMEVHDLVWHFIEEQEEEDLLNLFENYAHKLGGYPFFVQDDPRAFLPRDEENYILLLQIDTDGNEIIDIMWGDCGVGNFFIKRSNLRKLDFSDVIYNWDCA